MSVKENMDRRPSDGADRIRLSRSWNWGRVQNLRPPPAVGKPLVGEREREAAKPSRLPLTWW